jgi:hypothetical protein
MSVNRRLIERNRIGVVPDRFKTLDDGWFVWLDDPTVKVRVEEGTDGRVRLVGLQLDGHVSASALRSIPVGRIEAAANAELHSTTPSTRRPKARIAASFRSNAVQGYPDAFYDAVASTYRHLAATSSRPVADLADANDVPLTTAQRWVKEARRRGLLAPGQRGKSG